MSNEDTKLSKSLSKYAGFVFRWQRYKTFSPDWDHDHCQGCCARFAEWPDQWTDTVYTEGWVTLWPVTRTAKEKEDLIAEFRASGYVLVPSPELGGFQLDWLCPNCFEACHQELGFVIDSKHPQWQIAGL